MGAGTQWPAPTTATDSELCSSATKEEDTLVSCEFDCGPPLPRKNMVNKGNARSMCWVCPPCVCATRAIIRSWGSRPDTKNMLDEIRAKDKFRWHALVRQCRIRNTRDEVGLSDLRTRKKGNSGFHAVHGAGIRCACHGRHPLVNAPSLYCSSRL